MKKEITALCVAMAALGVSGCGSDCNLGACGETAQGGDTGYSQGGDIGYSVKRSALFGELGGLPYNTEPIALTSEKTRPGRQKKSLFGNALAIGDIDNDGLPDIVTGQGRYQTHGQVIVKYGAKNDPYSYYFNNSETSEEADYYGKAIAVGKFCPKLTSGDIIVASAPARNSFRGAFGLIYSKSGTIETHRMLTNDGAINEIPGTVIAVGDVDGDGTSDLVFQSTPANNQGYLEPTVSVILNMCNVNGNYRIADKITAASNKNNLGSAIYIKDLDGKGEPEIIIVDNSYKLPEYADIAASGAIYFYRVKDGKFVQSREMIVGDINYESEGAKAGAQISAVEFADLDGDGDLDLIVGEPMYITEAKREGRVRTYTNPGPGQAFDASDPLWMFSSGHSNLRFGSTLKVADLNYDGVEDLIVGAPGFSKPDTGEYGQSYVYIFMGTKDGSIFSHVKTQEVDSPFWSYRNPVASEQYEDFGRTIEVANLDKKGWLDLVVGAPLDSAGEVEGNYGRIDIFMESEGFCYTADRCLVDGKCYEPSEVSADSKCMMCDPKQDNFGFSELVCEDKEDDCHKGSTCDPQMGCVLMNKPDGTACGKNACTKSNALVTRACSAGVCTAQPAVSCGVYVCDASLSSCPTSCNKDSECMDENTCRVGVCSANAAPVITLEPEFSVVRGRSVKLSAKAVDPDGDAMVYSWSATPTDGISFSNETTLTPTVSVASKIKGGEEYTVTLTVTDKNSVPESSTAQTKLKVLGGEIVIVSPADNSVLTTSEISFSGTTNLSGTIALADSKAGSICDAQVKNNKWSCSKKLVAGVYEIVAAWKSDTTEVSNTLHLTVKDPVPDNKPPVISVADEFTGIPGEVITIDASKTSDPDGDSITFEWSAGEYASQLSSTTDSKVSFTIPSDASAGDVYTLTLRVTDSKKDSSVASVHVIVAPHAYTVGIDYPVNGDVLHDSPLVSGTTDWTGKVAVVDRDSTILCTAVPEDGLWACNPGLDFGTWAIRAYLDGSAPKVYSDEVTFKIIDEPANQPPRVVLEANYQGVPGQSLTLDASGSSDPEGGKLSFEWTEPKAGLLSDTHAAAPVFTVPSDAAVDSTFEFTVTVTDDAGLTADAKTVVKVLPGESPDVKIVSPKNGDVVAEKFVVSGMASGVKEDAEIQVRDSEAHMLCTAAVGKNGEWSCQATLEAGEYTLYAHVIYDGISYGHSEAVAITVEGVELPVPVIKVPANGEVIPVRPGIEGTVDAAEGVVSVWSVEGSVSALLCLADVSASGDWKCTVGYNLEYDRTYTFRASYQVATVSSDMGGMSDAVIVKTQPQEVADIKITSPANGSRLPSDYPVIFGGNAEPTTVVDVYISADEDKSWSKACTATANESGRWACSDARLAIGSYIIYADDARDNKVIPSARVAFEVYAAPVVPSEPDPYYGARGGSCAMAPVSGSPFAWMFLVAGFIGIGVIRRRRLS
ncbi:MAG: FG-GAP repeat protein [Proteobacteria bacterium]|nr:FG-GAP repeat protein [Pseudomonadota bacterium]